MHEDHGARHATRGCGSGQLFDPHPEPDAGPFVLRCCHMIFRDGSPGPAASGGASADLDFFCILLQTVGMDAAQRAAGAVVSLVDGGPPPAPGPPDGITTTLAGMSKAQLYEILAQMKGLIQQNPAQARQILVTSPQLAKALFQVRRGA